MSMREYAVNDYGLIMDGYALKMIASKVCKDYTDEEYKEDEDLFNYDLYEKGIVEYISDFTGEAFTIGVNGEDVNFGQSYDNDLIYYVPASKISTLFKAAYKNIDEMVDEFKEKVSQYLPDDFNYHMRICHIVGTYWG